MHKYHFSLPFGVFNAINTVVCKYKYIYIYTMAFLNVKAMLALQLRYFPTRHSVTCQGCRASHSIMWCRRELAGLTHHSPTGA